MHEICLKEKVIDHLSSTAESNVKRLTDIEKRQIEIHEKVSYIKEKIDNGLSSTVEDMHVNLVRLIPVIDRHTALEKRLEDVFWWLVKILIAAVLGVVTWAVAMGWRPQ